MPTIIEQTANGLYKHPERTVATFPSGLVRIDQSYSCGNAAEPTHRATLAVGNELPDDDGYPSIDGAYIFPHAQQVRRGTGFTEFVVSAYGRTTTAPSNFQFQTETIQSGVTRSYKLLTFTCDVVHPSDEALDLTALNIDPNITEPFDFFYLNKYNTVRSITNLEKFYEAGLIYPPNGGVPRRLTKLVKFYVVTFNLFDSTGIPLGTTQEATFNLSEPAVTIVSQTNFGRWTEYKIDVNYRVYNPYAAGNADPMELL